MRTMVLAMESPSPVPPVARLIHAVEALEDVFQLVGRNAAALVAHGQARAVLVGRDGNANGSAGGRVAGGVVEKDEEQLAQQGFIRVYAQTGLRLRLIWMRGVDFTRSASRSSRKREMSTAFFSSACCSSRMARVRLRLASSTASLIAVG